MSFRMRQKYKMAPSSLVLVAEDETLETGEIIRKPVKANKKLPSPDKFELKNLLAAGKTPEEVQSKIMFAKSINFNISEKENNNEN